MPEEQSADPTISQVDGEKKDAGDPKAIVLSTLQEQALQQLAAGTSIRETARVIGVHRRTVHRWLAADSNFAAAYNAWQRETVDSGRARVLAMTDLALDTVQTAIQQGNARVAMQVAKATGALDAPRPKQMDPELLRRQRQIREGRRALRLAAEEKQYREEGGQPGELRYEDVVWLEKYIDDLMILRRTALNKETPEVRAARLAMKLDPDLHCYPGTLRLLRLADEEHNPRLPLPSETLPATTEVAGTAPPISPAPSAAPTLSGASVVTKATAVRVVGSGQIQSVNKPYDPDAVDPLDDEHWVNL